MYLLPFAKAQAHYWRFDFVFEQKRKTLSLGVYPETGLALAREKTASFRRKVAAGENPSDERASAEKRLDKGRAPWAASRRLRGDGST